MFFATNKVKKKYNKKQRENEYIAVPERFSWRVEVPRHVATRLAHHNYDPRIISGLGMLIRRLGNEIAGLGSRKELP